MKDPDTAKENQVAHEIMHMFQYNYKEQWVPQKVIYQRNRLWTKIFNDLLSQGLIKRKKTFHGYQYKWNSPFP